MIVFEVFLNGRRVTRAGAKDLGVLSASVTGVGRLGSSAVGMAPDNQDLHLTVGGLTARRRVADEHVDWLPMAKLNVGDEVRIQVTNTRRADKPKRRRKARASHRQPSERKRFEWAKAVYTKLRPKYERQILTTRSSGRSKTRAAEPRRSA